MPLAHLDGLDLAHALQGWESPRRNRGVTGAPLSVAGRGFARGIGTHTVGWLGIDCAGAASRFSALVGIDDAVGAQGWGAARFLVLGDGRVLADSGVVRGGQPAVPLHADLRGVHLLELVADAPADHTHHGHADWCDPVIVWEGTAPRSVPRPRGEPVRRGPAPDPRPRFVAGHLAGARPGAPFLYTIPCLGDDLRFAAEGLPDGLALDAGRGVIAGIAPSAGRHPVRLSARNRHGQATRVLTICAGEAAPVPPMGWSSWNCCHAAIDAERIRANARALVANGLHRVGYHRINTDDGWQGERRPDSAIPLALQANAGFPDPAALAGDIHALGLLAGIYHVPTVHSPQGLAGGSADHADGRIDAPFAHGAHSPVGAHAFWDRDIAQFAAWGFDYLKVDNGPSPEVVAAMAAAVAASGRDITLSLSAGMPRDRIESYRGHAQLWRTTGDLIDTWFSLRNKLRSQVAWQGVGRPGGWNDPDMLVVGEVGPGWNAPLQPSRLAYEEQYLHVGMWAFLAAPLIIGGDLTRLDPFTRDLLANPAVIELDQDPLGAPPVLIDQDGERGTMRWRRDLAGGARCLALVDLGDEARELGATAAECSAAPGWRASDVWTGEDLGRVGAGLRVAVPARGHRLVRLDPA